MSNSLCGPQKKSLATLI